MYNNVKYIIDDDLIIDSNPRVEREKKLTVAYEIMHKDMQVAYVTLQGRVQVFNTQFMPYDLYLENEEGTDIDAMLNNLDNFYHWCASRVLTLDRTYAKEILNSIGAVQATTDRDRAKISLSYHCVSLTDVYWVREQGEAITFSELNLYDNTLNEAVVELSLKGRQMTVTNRELAQDLSTKGCFPKAWVRGEGGFRLLKDGGEDTVRRELLASQICQCFDIPQVKYKEYFYDGQLVTESEIVTSKRYSIASKMAYEIYCTNHDRDVMEECIKLDSVTYYGMNILDYLTGNTDRHPENWGVLVDNETNLPVSLYPLMDFNQSFLEYDTIEGGVCQTVYPRSMTQREAAIEAVKQIGLRQLREMDMDLFNGLNQEAEMFVQRLDELKKYTK